jgi:hypothetical protein
MRELRILRICQTGLTDSGILQLHTLSALEYLEIGPHVSKKAAENLKTALPACAIESYDESGVNTFTLR